MSLALIIVGIVLAYIGYEADRNNPRGSGAYVSIAGAALALVGVVGAVL